MGNIEFKVYISKLDRIFDVERICFDINTVEIRLDEGDFWEFNFDEVELMTYIGKLDKTGKKIFTGYSIETEDADGIVVYLTDVACFALEYDDVMGNKCYMGLPQSSDELLIVGTKYDMN